MSRTRKTLLIIFGIVGALVLVGFLGIALLFASFRKSAPTIHENSVLTLSISGALPDYVQEDPLRKLFGGPQQSLSSLVLQFKKAKVDKRIAAILLDIDNSGAGWGKSEELRDAITDFRSSGKPVYAYMEFGLNKEYYIASACDKIYLAPPGELFVNGLAADVMFFRGSLDKLGIYPDIYQIGAYKSAGDMFTKKEMTKEHREFIESLVTDLYDRLVAAIAKGRHKTPAEVIALIDNAPYNAKSAQEAGLIDGAAYRADVEKELKRKLGYKDDDALQQVRASDYRDVEPESLGINKGENIAVIYATGDIGSGRSENSPSGGQSIGSDTLARAIDDAREDKTIKAIVLRVDSPGGSSLASDLIWHAVDEARQKKPVVISMSDVAASGGYYIAAAASKIVAEPSTITGSIGVVAGKPVVKGLYDWLGITNQYVMKGKMAGLFRETEQFSPEERKKFEGWINETYQDFIAKVAKGRRRTTAEVDAVGQGRVWTGAQGKDRGLVDEFGGLDRAVEVAKELAGIPKDKGVHRVILPYPRTFLQDLLSRADDDSETAETPQLKQQRAILAAMPEDTRRAFRYALMLDKMKDGDAMLVMPFDVRFK